MTKLKKPLPGDIWADKNSSVFIVSLEEVDGRTFVNALINHRTSGLVSVLCWEIGYFLSEYKYKGDSKLYYKNFFKELVKVKCNHKIVEIESAPSEYEPSLVYYVGVCRKCGEIVSGSREKE